MENENETDSKQLEVLEPDAVLENPDKEVEPRFPFKTNAQIIKVDRRGEKFVKCPETSAKIISLAQEGLSKQGVATLAGITLNQLKKHYMDDYVAGQGGMEVVVARAAMEQVKAGNPQMIMFVAKTKLGWSEHNIIEHTGTVQAVISAKPLSKEQFIAKYLEKNEAGEDDDT